MITDLVIQTTVEGIIPAEWELNLQGEKEFFRKRKLWGTEINRLDSEDS